MHQFDVGARQRRAVGQSLIMADVEIIALQDAFCEQSQLAGAAATLALQVAFGQAGFPTANLGCRLAAHLDLVGDGLEEFRAALAAGVAVASSAALKA